MLSIAEKVASLKEMELFSGVPGEDLIGIAEIAQELHLSDGQTVFRAGEKGDAVYFVVSGQMRIHKSGTERLEQLIIENAHSSPAELKEIILQELDKFCQGVVQADDVSLMIVRMGV